MISQPPKNSIIPGSSIAMGICEDDVTVKNKTVILSNFKLVDGALISVKFTSTSTASESVPSTITLNVNNTGAKSLYVYTEVNNPYVVKNPSPARGINSNAAAILRNRYIGLFYYDGFSWMMLNYNNGNTIDWLTSSSVSDALSANQGRILKGYIDDINTKLDGVETLLSNI